MPMLYEASFWKFVLLIGLSSGIFSWLETPLVEQLMRRRGLLDVPGERSSHSTPTPKGGGIALIGAVLFSWFWLWYLNILNFVTIVIPLSMIILSILSWINDLKHLSPFVRLPVHATAAAIGIFALPGVVFQGWLPPVADKILAVGLWVYFMNIFNFMDGIDGLASSEAIAICLGLVLLTSFDRQDHSLTLLSIAVIGAAIGFLRWNWSPARIFMGDVGSIALGYLLGFLLLSAAEHGSWAVAIILPLYFLADATLTLIRRTIRGEPLWRPHKEHFYQRALVRLDHADVVRRVTVANCLLILFAYVAEAGWGLTAFLGSSVVTVGLLVELSRKPQVHTS